MTRRAGAFASTSGRLGSRGFEFVAAAATIVVACTVLSEGAVDESVDGLEESATCLGEMGRELVVWVTFIARAADERLCKLGHCRSVGRRVLELPLEPEFRVA